MRFNQKLKFLFVTFFAAFTLVSTSCSYFFESKEERREVDIPSEDTQCLTQTSKVFQRFFESMNEDQSLDDSIVNQAKCLQNAVVKFSTYVKSGEGNRQSYNAQEILNVLNIFFEEEKLPFELSLSLIEDFLKIKEFLIGGSGKSLTKKELQRIDKLIGTSGKAFLSIRPYREILLDSDYKLERNLREREEFDKAFSVFREASDDLLKLLRPWSKGKTLDLYKAGEFLLKLYHGDEFEDKKPYLQLFVEFKKTVLNDDNSTIERKDLDFFVDQTFRVYQSIFEYNHFVEDGALFNSLGALACFIVKIPQQLKSSEVLNTITYDSLGRIYNRSAQALIQSARRGELGRISMDKFSGLLEVMEGLGYLGKHLTAKSLTFFISNLTEKWMVDSSLKMAGTELGVSSYQPYFTEKKILYTLKHIRGWQDRQTFINQVAKGKEFVDLNEVHMEGLSDNVKDWIRILKKTNLKHWAAVESGKTDDKNFRLLFTKKDQRLNYRELTVNNSIYTEVRFFMQPFQNHAKGIKSYTISEDQTQAIYELMRHIGIELAFMDSRIYDTGRRAFMEANLFSTATRADKKIDVYEGLELMSYLYNSGLLSEEIYEAIPSDLMMDDLDVLRKKLIQPEGFRKFMRKSYMKFFLQLPGLQKHWASLSDSGQKEFVHVLEKAARGGVISEKPMDMGAIRIMVAVTYYLESFFYNFNSNKDAIVYKKELVMAEKHFHNTLHEVVEKNQNKGLKKGDPEWESFDEDYVDNIFYYILEHKEIPDPDAWSNIWYVGLANSWQKISRSDVLHVFSILSDLGRKTAIQRVKTFLKKHQVDLLEEVESLEEAPQCRGGKNLFCQWARTLQCNTDVYEHLLKQMKVSRNRFKSLEDLNGTVEALAEWMLEDDILLQTKCGYPYVEKSKKEEEASKNKNKEEGKEEEGGGSFFDYFKWN